jgi:hypothetical protein
MATFCDRLLANGTITASGTTMQMDLLDTKGGPVKDEEFHPVLIDNVARYYYDRYMGKTKAANMDIPEHEIANIAPPFRAFFMEWDVRQTPQLQTLLGIPGEAHFGVSWACTDLKGLHDVSLKYAAGKELNGAVDNNFAILVEEYRKKMAEDPSDTFTETGMDWSQKKRASFESDPVYLAWLKMTGMAKINPLVITKDDHQQYVNAQTVAAALYPHTDIRWIYQSMGYVEYPKGQIRGPIFSAMTPVKSTGSMTGTGIMHRANPEMIVSRSMQPLSFGNDEMAKSMWVSYYLVMPCLFAINFLHMKNVLLLPNRPEPKLAKKYRKEHRKDLVKYFTMHVVTPKQAIRYEKTSEIPDDIKQRVSVPFHIRQGAWRHYADEPGHRLFGKYAGDFFVPSYAAGKRDEGTNVATRAIEVHA